MIVIILVQLFTCFSGTYSDYCPNKTHFNLAWDKIAIHPYKIIPTDRCSCRTQCEEDTSCNAYSFDSSNDTCSLSTCNTYNKSITCEPCRFFRKINQTSLSLCEPVTTMSNITTIESNTTTEKYSTIEQTTPVEHITTMEQTTTEKQLTTKEQTASEKQHTADKLYTTIEHSTVDKLSTLKEQLTTVTWLTTLISFSNTTTINDTTKNTINNALCVCVCKYVNQTRKESIENRRRELILNKTELSSNIRKRTSAPDTRKASKVVGAVATIILVVFGLLFLCADIWTLLAMCHSKILHKNNPIDPNV